MFCRRTLQGNGSADLARGGVGRGVMVSSCARLQRRPVSVPGLRES